MNVIYQACRALLLLAVITGLAYPAFVTFVAQALFNDKANASLVVRRGSVCGAELIGQEFSSARYFWSRPSATVSFPYNPLFSSGSNLSVTNPELVKRISERVARYRKFGLTRAVPGDLVTASGSGLDPHISPGGAYAQAERISEARHLQVHVIRKLIDQQIEPRTLGVIGEPRVNVLLLNLALDRIGNP